MLTTHNKIIMMALVLGSSLFLGTVAAAAEMQTTTSAHIGLALPLVGDLDDIADPGIAIAAQAMHRVNPYESYGVGMSYASFGKDSMDQVNTEVSIISMLAMVRHDLAPKGNRSPFFEGGFGFARTQVNVEASNATGAPVTRGNNEEDISPTFLLGVGFDMPVSAGATFGVSVDYQHFFFKVGDVDGGGSLNLLAHLRV